MGGWGDRGIGKNHNRSIGNLGGREKNNKKRVSP
jgi:hypothetical protein